MAKQPEVTATTSYLSKLWNHVDRRSAITAATRFSKTRLKFGIGGWCHQQTLIESHQHHIPQKWSSNQKLPQPSIEARKRVDRRISTVTNWELLACQTIPKFIWMAAAWGHCTSWPCWARRSGWRAGRNAWGWEATDFVTHLASAMWG